MKATVDSKGYVTVTNETFEVLAARYSVEPENVARYLSLCVLCKERLDIGFDHLFSDNYSRFDFEFPAVSLSIKGNRFSIKFDSVKFGDRCSVYFGEHMFITSFEGEIEIFDKVAKLSARGVFEYDEQPIEFTMECNLGESAPKDVTNLFREHFPV